MKIIFLPDIGVIFLHFPAAMTKNYPWKVTNLIMRVNTFVSIPQSVADMLCTSQKGCVGFEHAYAIDYKCIINISLIN